MPCCAARPAARFLLLVALEGTDELLSLLDPLRKRRPGGRGTGRVDHHRRSPQAGLPPPPDPVVLAAAADPEAVGQRVAANPATPVVMSWCRGAPVACAAGERHVTVARNGDRVRNPAEYGGIGGV